MYLPFLRGKIFELKAIKEFITDCYSTDGVGRHIMPIIEPVKSDLSPIYSCMCAMNVVGMPYAIVLNSRLDYYKKEKFAIEEFLKDKAVQEAANWSPAFDVCGNNAEEILALISDYHLTSVMLLFQSGMDYENVHIQRLLNIREVQYIVVSNLTASRTMSRRLRDTQKRVITIDDCFRAQQANRDYADQQDELFSDVFSYYGADGLWGFSDYTTLAKDYKPGGVLPEVVAIHLTYQKNAEEIYVHHFITPKGIDGRKDIRLAYHEAAKQVRPYFDENQISKTLAIDELGDLEYHGLGAIKKQSIKNHLEMISRILNIG